MEIPKIKSLKWRIFFAEFLGTFILVLFGNGAIAQLMGQGGQPFIHIAFGYGLALTLGILISGEVTGGHLNPAVTLALATIKKCKWNQVLVYWAAQYSGAFLASALLYGTYYDFIIHQENATAETNSTLYESAGIFATYPGAFGPSTGILFLDQLLGTALLLIIILSVNDKHNKTGLAPLYIGLGLTAIHLSFALNAGCAINPARDFSPRLFTLIVFGKETFTNANYFFWIPWLIPHVGGIVGAHVYYYLVEHHAPP